MNKKSPEIKPHKQAINPLPFAYYIVPFFLMALIGIAASIYLSISHYRVHSDPYYSSFCAVSRALNCDTVSSSHYAIILNIPIAVWGIIGYLIVLTILVAAVRQGTQKKRLWPTLFWISLIYCIGSLFLAGISSFLINSYCLMCILTYLVNFSLLYYAWFVNRRFGDAGLIKGAVTDYRFLRKLRKFSLSFVSVLLLLISAVIVGMPQYWKVKSTPIDASVAHGITADGYPWIGAVNPKLTIHEFSDYMCFQCRKMHFFLRELIRLNPSEIRLVHRHCPMDHAYNPMLKEPFHTGSGKMAILSLYAQERNQFWKMNDYFFNLATKKSNFNTRTIAQEMGVSSGELAAALDNKYLRLRLKHDIAVGIEKGIDGTPGFIINDQICVGNIPPEILKKYVK